MIQIIYVCLKNASIRGNLCGNHSTMLAIMVRIPSTIKIVKTNILFKTVSPSKHCAEVSGKFAHSSTPSQIAFVHCWQELTVVELETQVVLKQHLHSHSLSCIVNAVKIHNISITTVHIDNLFMIAHQHCAERTTQDQPDRTHSHELNCGY